MIIYCATEVQNPYIPVLFPSFHESQLDQNKLIKPIPHASHVQGFTQELSCIWGKKMEDCEEAIARLEATSS